MSRFAFLLVYLLFCSVAYAQQQTDYASFSLSFTTTVSDAGSQTMHPGFRVTGRDFVYLMEQNCYYGQPTRKNDTLCTGLLRPGSIDSILQITGIGRDELITKIGKGHNTTVQYLHIKYPQTDVTFELHHATHPLAVQIVDILNTHLPAGVPRLYIGSPK